MPNRGKLFKALKKSFTSRLKAEVERWKADAASEEGKKFSSETMEALDWALDEVTKPLLKAHSFAILEAVAEVFGEVGENSLGHPDP